MISNFYKPTPALAEIVEHYWYFKIGITATAIHHLPTPLFQCLAFNYYTQQAHYVYNNNITKLDKPVYFFGQQTCSRIMATNEKKVHILIVKFKSLGIVKLTGINMGKMADCIINAHNIWGRELEFLCNEMRSEADVEGSISVLEKFLLKKSTQIILHHRVNSVANALSLIEDSKGTINTHILQYKTNTSRKTLERAFMNYVGINPKLYSEITRFNAAKERIDNKILNKKLSGIAYDLDFCHGSHFSAEFKRFANMSPTEYLQGAKCSPIFSL